jgi:hypothetical protein
MSEKKDAKLRKLAHEIGRELTEIKELVESGRGAEIPQSRTDRIKALLEQAEKEAKNAGYKNADEYLDCRLKENRDSTTEMYKKHQTIMREYMESTMTENDENTDWQTELRQRIHSRIDQLIAEGKQDEIGTRARRLLEWYSPVDEVLFLIRDAVFEAHEAGISMDDNIEDVHYYWDWLTKYDEDRNTAKDILAGETTLEEATWKLRRQYEADELEDRLRNIESDIEHPEVLNE